MTEALLAELEGRVPLTPLHQPHNLAVIRSVAASVPVLPQVACFDTSFHRTQDRLAQLFALPRALSDDGILRYGFHGLYYYYVAASRRRPGGRGRHSRTSWQWRQHVRDAQPAQRRDQHGRLASGMMTEFAITTSV